MQLKELSEATGTSPASIKFYLREGLLPHGETIHATRARYTKKHAKRLELIRALRHILGLNIGQIHGIVRLGRRRSTPCAAGPRPACGPQPRARRGCAGPDGCGRRSSACTTGLTREVMHARLWTGTSL